KQYKEALASYDQALNFKPDDAGIFYNKACCYALQGNVALALENLERAIKPNPEKYREMAKTDSYFDTIRDDIQFQVLIQ
ncbi:MAG TPA: hypothetical protein DEG47_05735, partial [Cyanobacteria bacterium UBA11148]|nr:hypothetical protein [Cyanobacteria bacterium UBA11148]